MLRMLGLGGGPGPRVAIGAVLVAIGLARHGLPIAVIGGALVVWGLAAWAGAARS
jgi:hypothetical protein